MKIKISVSLAIFLLLGYLFATPYIVVYQMKNAAENKDGKALSQHIDFSALRQSLSTQLNGLIDQEISKISKDDLFLGVGKMIGQIVTTSLLESYLTLETITNLMEGYQPKEQKNHIDSSHQDSSHQTNSKPFSDISLGYQSIDRFVVITIDKKLDKEIKFIFWRKGIDWKLSEIILPVS